MSQHERYSYLSSRVYGRYFVVLESPTRVVWHEIRQEEEREEQDVESKVDVTQSVAGIVLAGWRQQVAGDVLT